MRELRQLLTGSATAWRRGVAAFFQRNTGITRAGLPDLIDTLEEFAAEHGRPTPPADIYPHAPKLELAKPLGAWRLVHRTLARVLKGRRSTRRFGTRPISAREIATLLRLGYGPGEAVSQAASRESVQPETQAATVPSAGGLFPLQVYLIARHTELPYGVWHYHWQHSFLSRVRELPTGSDGDCPAILRGNVVAVPPLDIVITTRCGVTLQKYGDRGLRYALLECGHLAQNLMLVAEWLDLGTVALGGFLDAELSQWLGLDPRVEQPQYVIAVGPRP